MKWLLVTFILAVAVPLTAQTQEQVADDGQSKREAYAKVLEAQSNLHTPEMKATFTAEGARLIVRSPAASQKLFDQLMEYRKTNDNFFGTLRSYGFTEYVFTNSADLTLRTSTAPLNLAPVSPSYQPQPWPQQPWGQTEIVRAVDGAKQLRGMMRDPDSFVLESAALVLGKNGYDVCYAYRARNGYGGMNRSQSNLTTKDEVRTGDNAWMMSPYGHHKGVTLPDITDLVLERLPRQGGRQ